MVKDGLDILERPEFVDISNATAPKPSAAPYLPLKLP